MSNARRLYDLAIKSAKNAAGGEAAFWIIGSTFRTALVSQEILTILALQNEAVSADRVRSLLHELRDLLDEDEELRGI